MTRLADGSDDLARFEVSDVVPRTVSDLRNRRLPKAGPHVSASLSHVGSNSFTLRLGSLFQWVRATKVNLKS
jgi:hypothetical protein